jgi:hypothetical protein
MKSDAVALERVSALPHNSGQTFIERITKAHVRNETTLEESKRSNALRAVDDLVRYDKVTWLDFFLERTNRGERYDGSYADAT